LLKEERQILRKTGAASFGVGSFSPAELTSNFPKRPSGKAFRTRPYLMLDTVALNLGWKKVLQFSKDFLYFERRKKRPLFSPELAR
jgi:hypothetical protein